MEANACSGGGMSEFGKQLFGSNLLTEGVIRLKVCRLVVCYVLYVVKPVVVLLLPRVTSRVVFAVRRAFAGPLNTPHCILLGIQAF